MSCPAYFSRHSIVRLVRVCPHPSFNNIPSFNNMQGMLRTPCNYATPFNYAARGATHNLAHTHPCMHTQDIKLTDAEQRLESENYTGPNNPNNPNNGVFALLAASAVVVCSNC